MLISRKCTEGVRGFISNSWMVLLALSSSVAASDSMWLLCDDGGLALNVYEHRAGQDIRAIDLTLLFGAHVLTGTLKSEVDLRGKNHVNFKGRVQLTNKNSSVAVNGSLFIGSEAYPINALLKCRVFDK